LIQREDVFRELVLRLILSGRQREALEELELWAFLRSIFNINDSNLALNSYLPSFPYQDNPVLHIYAGLAAFYLAQPSPETMVDTRSFRNLSGN
jgi:RNA polymerase I-specific transcription initiation factor RRN11